MKILSAAMLLSAATIESPDLEIKPHLSPIENVLMNEICEVKLEEMLDGFKKSPIENDGIYSLANPFTGYKYNVYFDANSPYVAISREMTKNFPLSRNRRTQNITWIYNSEEGQVHRVSTNKLIEDDTCVLTHDMWKKTGEFPYY